MGYKGTKLHNFAPHDDVTKLEMIDTDLGKGAIVGEGSSVTVHYTGALAKNGIIFESSFDTGRAINFSLDEVIEGWKLGVPGMKIGGTRRLIIPADLAYGSVSPSRAIPANSDLVFDIDLIAITRPGA